MKAVGEEALSTEESRGTEGLGDMKLTCGTSTGSIRSRTRKAGKFTWVSHKRRHHFYGVLMIPTDQFHGRAFTDELDAARAHDLAALKLWGPETILNFPVEMYREEYKEMQTMSKEEVLASVRRRSNGFARGTSKYRGVARHHKNGRWEARLSQDVGCKYIYLGTYATQEEAAQAYDLAALVHKGPNIVTNFASSVYKHRLQPFMQLLVKPETEPAQEDLGVMQMEATETIDQTMPNYDLPEISWTFDIDHDLGAYPLLDVPIEDDQHDILNDLNFEGNIEHLFEEFETFGGNESGSDGFSASKGA
ncbi:uncharacterized protein [Elaeis guineensis]|uniref:uncharacterized protein isoform X2 n=1 Tax=Elaeis guineensis var. tenera TaxID=51953 RepID=UPI003C6D2BA2